MAKTIFDNDGVAHAWARGADEARTSNGNFYSVGRVLYSYGSHFVVGVRVGVSDFVLNTDNYSISTSRHKSQAWRAVRGGLQTRHALPALTSVVDPLRRLADLRNRDEKPDAGLMQRIRAYMVENASGISDESGAWLADFAGIKGDAIGRAKRERARLDAAKARKDAATKRETAKRLAITYADMTAPEFREHVRAVASGYNGVAGINAVATDLRRCRIVAKKEGLSLKRLNAIRAKLALLEVLDSARVARIAYRQKEKREHIALIRSWTRNTNGRRDTLCSRDVARLAYSAGRMAELVPYMRPAMTTLRLAAQEESARRGAVEMEEERAERAKRDAEYRRSTAERRERWLSGESDGRYGVTLSDENGGALLRAVGVERNEAGDIIGGTLETGHGADVPLVHAVKAFRFVKLVRSRGETWERNGKVVRVGHFQIDRIDADGFDAGCHRINWPEIQRVAAALGVLDMAGDDSAVERSTVTA